MEKFLQHYAKIPAKQRYALAGLIAVAMVGGYYYLYHLDDTRRLSDLQQQYAKLEAERAEKQAYIDNLAKYEARLNELQQDLNKARAQLPDAADVPQLLAQLGNKARQSGLTIVNFEPKGESLREFVAELNFATQVKGSYHEVATFIDSVGKLDRIVNVSALSLETPKTVNKKILLDAKFTLSTFRFLGDQPEKKK
ncbi:MAG: type 4a pilus biogenesis protein PilO [Deltaproteobacteria bacterium]|nr:type 4a pilus biogenesis protein PilO [Deltaproteobacteria bacterium]